MARAAKAPQELIPSRWAAACPILHGPDEASLFVAHGMGESHVARRPRRCSVLGIDKVVALLLHLSVPLALYAVLVDEAW